LAPGGRGANPYADGDGDGDADVDRDADRDAHGDANAGRYADVDRNTDGDTDTHATPAGGRCVLQEAIGAGSVRDWRQRLALCAGNDLR